MTCIVGIVDKGTVYIGGDSAGLADWNVCIRSDKKVFVNNGFAIGFAHSFRLGQLLSYSFKPPVPKPREDLMRFMATTFIDAVRDCLKAGGFATRQADAEIGGNFLVGYRGRLFHVNPDYQVGEMEYGLHAIGCGEAPAMGALHAMPKSIPARTRVLKALAIAEKCTSGVRGPFHVVSTK